jgi:glycosyltransferase involved in cell wall biosynthesis
MVEDDQLRSDLAQEAVTRPLTSWREYAQEVVARMVAERCVPTEQPLPEPMSHDAFYGRFINVSPRPLLSVCINTCNQADWLSLTLRNLAPLLSVPSAKIELVVCDNASTGDTRDVARPYLDRSDFHYFRNSRDVGTLGSQRTTAHHAQGKYLWILGDGDLIKPGAIEKVLHIMERHPGIALIHLNYGHARNADPRSVIDLDRFLADSSFVTTPGPDICGTVRDISTESESFFTTNCCLVFRRDHALRAYSQNPEGRLFSSLATCTPTAYYVLRSMMNESAYWVGEPQVVVNPKTPGKPYAPLSILERIPEAQDLAERMGADPLRVDHWRKNIMQRAAPFLQEILENGTEGDAEYFSPARFVGRIKHLDDFVNYAPVLRSIYERAYYTGHPAAKMPVSVLFPAPT